MKNNHFTSLAKKHFDFLIDQYGFSYKEIYKNGTFGNARVEFYSPKTLLRIKIDLWDIFFEIGPLEEFDTAALSLEFLIKFITAENISLPIPKLTSKDDYVGMNLILEQYSRLLRQYCTKYLKGDFSDWNNALKYFITKSRETYRSITGIEDTPEAFQDIEDYIKRNQA